MSPSKNALPSFQQLRSKTVLKFLNLPRNLKRSILIFIDFSTLCFALWSALSLRFGTLYIPPNATMLILLLAAPALSILCFRHFGLYKHVTRFIRHDNGIRLFYSMGLSIMIWCILVYMAQGSFAGFPRSVFIIYGFSSVLYILAIRSIFSYILNVENITGPINSQSQKTVLIYGAGVEGIQLYNYLKNSENYNLVGFIDENKSLWGQRLYETYVSAPEDISELIERHQVKEVFLAHPKMTSKSKQVLLNKLLPLGVQLKVLPTLKDLASGRATISDFKHFELADLLRRNKNLDENEPSGTDQKDKNLLGKSVMITGAGGSVGSELVRQVAQKKPKRIILFERSELALYQIEHELQKISQSLKTDNEDTQSQGAGFEIVTVLGSVTDQNLVQRAITANQVETIYHAAAYKLIPFIEQHPLTAIENNIIGTATVASMASQQGVELFVFVSTDQAHEPGHIMGASKRFSEKHLKTLAGQPANKTIFTSVRFGNVLGSGDSVVELFSQQIREGGPVTVTDPEMSRHFMTMGEASRLILEAGGMATGGELFRLDKGQPIKILDLAKSLISLSGNEVATDSNSQNGIAIEIIGLREGEMLDEKTEYDREVKPTSHPKIHLCEPADEPSIEQFEEQLNQLKSALHARDIKAVKQILSKVVNEFKQCA